MQMVMSDAAAEVLHAHGGVRGQSCDEKHRKASGETRRDEQSNRSVGVEQRKVEVVRFREV